MFTIFRKNGRRKSKIAESETIEEAKSIASEKIKNIGDWTETPDGLCAPVDSDMFFGILIAETKDKPRAPSPQEFMQDKAKRRSEPATEKQMAYLNDLGINVNREITKGFASMCLDEAKSSNLEKSLNQCGIFTRRTAQIALAILDGVIDDHPKIDMTPLESLDSDKLPQLRQILERQMNGK